MMILQYIESRSTNAIHVMKTSACFNRCMDEQEQGGCGEMIFKLADLGSSVLKKKGTAYQKTRYWGERVMEMKRPWNELN